MTVTRFKRADLEEAVGDDPTLLASLIDLFLEVQPKRMQELEAQLSRGDAFEAAKTAHTLVGSFRSMAMPGPGGLAKAVENACRDGQLEMARDGFRALRPEYDALVAELKVVRVTLPMPAA